MTDHKCKLDRLAMHQEWYDKNRKMLFIEASAVMQELLAMSRQYKAERDEARREIMNSVIDQACSNEEIEGEYRKRGWSYLKKENNDG